MRGKPAKPVPPENLLLPGLTWRPRKDRWILSWSPRSDLVAKGYPSRVWRLWPRGETPTQQLEPSPQEWEHISHWCCHYQAETRKWLDNRTEPSALFDGTITSLIRLYQTDPDSPYKTLRWSTQVDYARDLRSLEQAIGDVRVARITFRDIKRWREKFETRGKATATVLMKMLKIVMLFAKIALPEEPACARVIEIMRDMAEARVFSGGRRKRAEFMTYAQARLLCEVARREGFPSIALAQAFMFELGIRQKDMIGEWVPRSEPGVTDVISGVSKWLMGARWDEIDEHFVWTHRLSKSVRRDGIMDTEAGKIEKFDLMAFPLVKAELFSAPAYANARAPATATAFAIGYAVATADAFANANVIYRSDFPASGPVIVNERTWLPWSSSRFRERWRQLAHMAGIPANVQNRDSRAGAATEADLAGVPREKVKRQLGHSNEATTAGYQRESMAIRSEIARARAEKRK